MDEQQDSPIAQFTTLLQEWVDASFPLPRTEEDIARLNGALWLQLIEMLCGNNMRRTTACLVEVRRLKDNGRAGDPPRQALAQRLEELVQVGMRQLFLVIAARQAVESIIAKHFPQTLVTWKQLADSVLPTDRQTGLLASEAPIHSGWSVYGPLPPE